MVRNQTWLATLYRIQKFLLILTLCFITKAEAFEIDLTNPYTTFETCGFEKYDYIPLDFASFAIANCYTREGKNAFIGSMMLGLAILEAFASLDGSAEPESKLNDIISKYSDVGEDLEKAIELLNAEDFDLFIVDLVEYTNEFNRPEIRPEEILSGVSYSEGLATGTVISIYEDRQDMYEIQFKRTSIGWLIHKIGNYERAE